MPFPSPGDLPDPGIEPGSPALQTDSLLSEPPCSQLGFAVSSLFRTVRRCISVVQATWFALLCYDPS